MLEKAQTLTDGTKVLASKLEAVEPKELRQVADELRNRMGSGCLALASVNEGKVVMLTAVTKDLTEKYNAGALLKEIGKVLGSKGGGKPDLAQAGGGDPAKLEEALDKFRELVQ